MDCVLEPHVYPEGSGVRQCVFCGHYGLPIPPLGEPGAPSPLFLSEEELEEYLNGEWNSGIYPLYAEEE